MTESPELATAGHVFISYVKEDRAEVEELSELLAAAGISVWTDKDNLGPGDDWKLKIQEAISQRALVFIACFSENSAARGVSYQNEELVLAVDQVRLRRFDTAWLMPVRFADVAPPVMPLGAGRMLSDLHYSDLFGSSESLNRVKLIAAILRVLGQAGQVVSRAPSASGPIPQSDQGAGDTSVEESVRRMIGDPSKAMALEELLNEESSRVHDQLNSLELFPTSINELQGSDQIIAVRRLVDHFGLYWDVVAPMAKTMATAGACASTDQARILTRSVQTVGATVLAQRSGTTALLSMRHYPLVATVYAGALSALARENFASLRAIANDPIVRDNGHKVPLISVANAYEAGSVPVADTVLVLSDDGPVEDSTIESLLQRGGVRYTPISDHLYTRLRPFVKKLVPADEDYDELFDLVEIYLGLLGMDAYLQRKDGSTYVRSPYFGRFTWKDRYRYDAAPPEVELAEEFQRRGSDWLPLRAGLFGGSETRAQAAFETFNRRAAEVRMNRH